MPFTITRPQPIRRVDGLTWLWRGIGSFTVATAVLVFVTESHFPREVGYLVLGVFAGVNVINSIAAYKLFVSIWYGLWHGAQRGFVGLCGIVVLLFASFSTFDLLAYASSVLPRNIIFPTDMFQTFTGEYDVVIWWMLLPLQAIVWLVLAIFLQIVRRYAHRRGMQLPDLTRDNRALYGFFLLALCAIGVMFYTMDGVVVHPFYF